MRIASARFNRRLGNPQRRKACAWCAGAFRPRKSETEAHCSTDCAVAGLNARHLAGAVREELRLRAVAARRALDEARAETLRANVARGAKMVAVVLLVPMLLAACVTLRPAAGPYRIGDITVLVMDDADQVNETCQALLPRPTFRYRGCWKRQGSEHLIVTDRDALTLVHELRHVAEGESHP